MYHNEHGVSHFHARYADREASIAIDPLEVIDSDLPVRVNALVLEWAAMHQEELLEEWRRAQTKQPLFPIAPLG